MKTWEYKIINVRSENYSMDPRRAEELNRLGDEGWELVSITSINFKTGATDHIGMVFKREKAATSSYSDIFARRMTSRPFLILIVIDGFGCRKERQYNAIAAAKTPRFDRL